MRRCGRGGQQGRRGRCGSRGAAATLHATTTRVCAVPCRGGLPGRRHCRRAAGAGCRRARRAAPHLPMDRMLPMLYTTANLVICSVNSSVSDCRSTGCSACGWGHACHAAGLLVADQAAGWRGREAGRSGAAGHARAMAGAARGHTTAGQSAGRRPAHQKTEQQARAKADAEANGALRCRGSRRCGGGGGVRGKEARPGGGCQPMQRTRQPASAPLRTTHLLPGQRGGLIHLPSDAHGQRLRLRRLCVAGQVAGNGLLETGGRIRGRGGGAGGLPPCGDTRHPDASLERSAALRAVLDLGCDEGTTLARRACCSVFPNARPGQSQSPLLAGSCVYYTRAQQFIEGPNARCLCVYNCRPPSPPQRAPGAARSAGQV